MSHAIRLFHSSIVSDLSLAFASVVLSCLMQTLFNPANAAKPVTQICYNPEDAVIIGRATNQTLAPISSGELIGYGVLDVTVNVTRTMHGNRHTVIRAKAVTHTFLREDQDYLFVARTAPSRGFFIIAYRIAGDPYQLVPAKQCEK